eukprot:Opistho-2@90426
MEVVNRCNWLASNRLADELNLVTLNLGDDHNLHLCQEVEGKVVDGVAENRLLHKEHVAAGLLDLLHKLQNVLALLAENAVHLRIVTDNHSVLHVCLWRREAKLDETNLGLLLARHTAGHVRNPLRKHKSIDKLAVLDGATELLYNANITEIHVDRRLGINHVQHSIHCDGGKQIRVLRDDLRVERGGCALEERFPVAELHGMRHARENFHSLVNRKLKRLRDGRGVDAPVEKLLRSIQKSAANNDNRRGAVAGLDILGLGQLNEHLCRRVQHLHLLENGCTVVCDGDLAVGCLDHLVHAARAEAGADGICNALCGRNVARAHLIGLLTILKGRLCHGSTAHDHFQHGIYATTTTGGRVV